MLTEPDGEDAAATGAAASSPYLMPQASWLPALTAAKNNRACSGEKRRTSPSECLESRTMNCPYATQTSTQAEFAAPDRELFRKVISLLTDLLRISEGPVPSVGMKPEMTILMSRVVSDWEPG
jgi:hypothetical protein